MKKFACLLFALALITIPSYAQTELTDEEIEVLENDIRMKVYDSYLPEIAGKADKSREEKLLAREYIKLALKLFIGEGEDYTYEEEDKYGIKRKRIHEAVKMQTTSNGIPNKPQPMKRYLNRLMNLKYQRVEVDTLTAVRIDKEIHPVGDGLYTATATFLQVFRGYRDNMKVIDDRDMKQVTIYIRKEVIDVSTGIYRFEVKLGDIRITSDWGEHD